MKKLLIACLFTILLLASLAVTASAVTNEANHWVENSPKHQEILAGLAGEESTAWEVPYLSIKPTLDGSIGKNEYLPFEMYEDYLAYMAIAQGNTEEDFNRFYEMASEDFFDAYWGWDGEYMYIAFEVQCLNGFRCTPEEMGSTSYLYAYNMLQVGISHVDAVGKDRGYVELGFGVNSENGESLAHTWAGPYYPVGGEDFVGTYDEDNETVIYEARIHLQTALGLQDTTVQNGDEVNYAWLLSVNGETSSVNDYWQVGFCHGIGGQYSNKQNQYMARITFTGLPDDVVIQPEELPGVSPEDLEYGLVESIDMSDEATVNTFQTDNVTVAYVTEGEESFMRITGFREGGYLYSTKYPRNLQSADCKYIAVKYRTSSADATELGILYRSAYYPEYDLEEPYCELIGDDGEWHVVIFYMDVEAKWVNWIVNAGLLPFADANDPSGDTLDIAYIKFYTQDPWDLFLSEMYEESEGTDAPAAETQAEDVTSTDTEVVTEASTEAVTTAEADTATEATTAAATSAEADTETVSDDGCASVVGLGSLGVLVTAMAAAVALRKKD